MIDCGALPNKTSKTVNTGLETPMTYFWIDPSNSFAFNNGACYPVPYADSASSNSLSVRLINNGAAIAISTASDWSKYACIICVKFTK